MIDASSNISDITSRLEVLRPRFDREHQMMRRLDRWRYLLYEEIADEVWEGVPAEERGETIAKPEINAVTDTLVAVSTSKSPSIAIRQKNSVAQAGFNTGNLNERIGHAIFHEVNRRREESLLAEGPEYMYHRGKGILKVLWLSPEERGEERRALPEGAQSFAGNDLGPLTDQNEEVTEGVFPAFMELLDPVNCFYTTNPLTGETTEMLHEFYTTWDAIRDMFPDIGDLPKFKDIGALARTNNGSVRVIDYWNGTYNAIIVNNQWYKQPTEHLYPWVPFVVQSGRLRQRNLKNNTIYRESVPFCEPMWKSVRDLSWALSLLATYMKEIGMAKLMHTGIPTDGSSPWFAAQRDSDGVFHDTDYRLVLDNSPSGRIVPLFFHAQSGVQERLEYARPPDMVVHWQAFAAERGADVEIVSFGRAFLSGVMTADLSGYSVSLQRQLSMARIEPYIMALNRLFSRGMHMIFELIARELEREGRSDVPLIIQGLVNEPDTEITAQQAANVGVVDFQFRPEIPNDRESEAGLVMQQYQSGLASPVTAIDALGYVQDATREFENIIASQEARSNPIMRKAIARKWARDNGYFEENDPADMAMQQEIEALRQAEVQAETAAQMQNAAMAEGGVPAESTPAEGGAIPPEMMQIIAGLNGQGQ